MSIYNLTFPFNRPRAVHHEAVRAPDLLGNVPSNVVQSIRAFRVTELREEAGKLGHHFLYTHCGSATTKQQVLASIATAFLFSPACCKTFDDLADCLTRLLHRAGPQPGFLIVLEQLPNTPRFDRDTRENLLDVFRAAADFWSGKRTAFRVFYSFQ